MLTPLSRVGRPIRTRSEGSFFPLSRSSPLVLVCVLVRPGTPSQPKVRMAAPWPRPGLQGLLPFLLSNSSELGGELLYPSSPLHDVDV